MTSTGSSKKDGTLMALNSINTNAGALIALQNLNVTATDLQKTQNHVSTGLAVAGATDNGAIWDIAQNSRAAVSSLDSVKQSLQRAQSTVDVAVSAGQTISDLLNQIKTDVLAGTDTSLDTVSRTALSQTVNALITQISKIVSNATFNNINLIKTGGTTLYALANSDGTSHLTVAAVSLAVGGANVTFTVNASFSTSTQATALLSLVNSSIINVNAATAKLGTESKAVTTHLTFISNLQDSLTTGIGNLVDADLAKESAQLTALQTKQQLGIQSLSIANSSKSQLLSLFK
jgi:flagellin